MVVMLHHRVWDGLLHTGQKLAQHIHYQMVNVSVLTYILSMAYTS